MTSILIIDDTLEDRQLMETLLKSSRDGVSVTKCASGADGLQKATTKTFDFVLLDLHLDGEEGLDVLADLRKAKPDLPVIILSGQKEGSVVSDTFRGGASGYITKTGLLDVGIWPAIDNALARSKQSKR